MTSPEPEVVAAEPAPAPAIEDGGAVGGLGEVVAEPVAEAPRRLSYAEAFALVASQPTFRNADPEAIAREARALLG